MRIRLDVELTAEEVQALKDFQRIARRFDEDSPIRIAAGILAFRIRVPADVVVGESLHVQARAAKKAAVKQAIREHRGNISAAARALGTSRQTVYTILGRK